MFYLLTVYREALVFYDFSKTVPLKKKEVKVPYKAILLYGGDFVTINQYKED